MTDINRHAQCEEQTDTTQANNRLQQNTLYYYVQECVKITKDKDKTWKCNLALEINCLMYICIEQYSGKVNFNTELNNNDDDNDNNNMKNW